MAKWRKGAARSVRKWTKPKSAKAEAFGKAFEVHVSKDRYGIAVFNKDTADMTMDKLRDWESGLVMGTSQQEVIWDAMVNGTKNLLGRAYAGTGKTFTALEGVTRMAKIEDIECKTSHSMMYAVLKEFYPGAKTNQYKVHDLVNDALGIRKDEYIDEKTLVKRNNIVSVVGLLKNTMLEATEENFYALCDRFSLDVDGASEREVFEVSRDTLQKNNEEMGVVDFDDMIYLPVLLGLEPKRKFKFLIVDEAQDYNVAQRMGALACAERVMAIGDEFQSIYAFRGADAYSIPNFEKALGERGGVEVLPLTMTRRCPKAVVESVKQFVPNYEAMPEAKEGLVQWKERIEARKMYVKGDMVLCRLNAPLCSEAYTMLRQGTKCKIQGRDFGKSLISFIKKLKPVNVTDLVDKLEDYRMKEMGRLKAKAKYRPVDNLIQAVNDKVGCINVFCEGKGSLEEVKGSIEMMFTDTKDRENVVTLSSVHKAKGDEARRVFILERDQMPSRYAKTEEAQQQERNIIYVSHTRSMQELYLVEAPGQKKIDLED